MCVRMCVLTYAMEDTSDSPSRKLLVTSVGEETSDVGSDLILPVQQLKHTEVSKIVHRLHVNYNSWKVFYIICLCKTLYLSSSSRSKGLRAWSPSCLLSKYSDRRLFNCKLRLSSRSSTQDSTLQKATLKHSEHKVKHQSRQRVTARKKTNGQS